MSDPRRFIGTNRVTWGGHTTRRFWIGPLMAGTLEAWQGPMPKVQIIRKPFYVGLSGFGYFVSVSR